MIDLIPAFIYAKDAHSRFTACNKMVAARMGVTPEEAIGKTDFDFYPREMAEKFFADEQALLKSGKPLLDCEEAGLDTVSGTTRVIVTSKIPLHDANGNLTGIVGTGFDITDRKAAEERMASSDRLESIGRLAAGVAHEINTPIQYLNDSVSFIREGVQELLAYIDKLHARDAAEARGQRRRRLPARRIAAGDDARGRRPVTHRRDRALDEKFLARRSERDERGRSERRHRQHAGHRAQRIQGQRGPRNRATARFPALPAMADRSTRWCSTSWSTPRMPSPTSSRRMAAAAGSR